MGVQYNGVMFTSFKDLGPRKIPADKSAKPKWSMARSLAHSIAFSYADLISRYINQSDIIMGSYKTHNTETKE